MGGVPPPKTPLPGEPTVPPKPPPLATPHNLRKG